MAKGVVLLAEVTLAELQLQPNHPAPRCTSVRGCESFHSPRLKAKPEARKTEGYNAYIRVVKVSIPLFIHENLGDFSKNLDRHPECLKKNGPESAARGPSTTFLPAFNFLAAWLLG